MQMYPENNLNFQGRRGRIEVICGSMYSGKTEELIRRIKRAKIARQKVEIFKPQIDVRYAENEVVSHNENRILSTPVPLSANIPLLACDADVVGIDEAQFFDLGLTEICNQLADKGIRVIVAGLDMDYLGSPFGPMPNIMAIAEEITKVHAVCVDCGYTANFSHRLSSDDKLILLGEKDLYIPLCRECRILRKNKQELPPL
jgi:thymidine kinase